MTVEEIRESIKPLNENAMADARAHWLTVAKPLFALGKLEEAVTQMAGIRGTANYEIKKKALIIMCADNGVVEEGVTQTGQEVTAQVTENFTRAMSSACIMAQIAGCDIVPVDIGVARDVTGVTKPEEKVAYGTKNFAKEPAMTKEQVLSAIHVGIQKVKECKEAGYDLIATGEMGIGNTTTSSAVSAVLTGRDVEEMTGRGAGLSSEGLIRKKNVIREAIALHKPDASDVVDVLSKVGGLDIAGLTGVFLGGAIYHIPVLIDGFISETAALCAVKLAPQAGGYILPSHVSKEPAGHLILDALGKSPLLTCDMCLGEGTGAVAAMPLYEMGLAVYQKLGSFAEMDIDQYKVLK